MDSSKPKKSLNHLVSVFILVTTIFQSCGAHPATQLDISKRDTPYNSALTLISVERQPTAGGNNFTVRFTKNADHLIFRVQDNLDAPREPSVVEGANGVWAASFVAPTGTHEPLYFVMGDSNFKHMVALKLDNDNATPEQQNINELPVIHISPSSEAVYEPQEDIIVTAFVPRNSQTGEYVSNFRKAFSGLDLNTMTMHQDLDDDDLFTLGMPQTTADRIQASITIHTSSRPLSGHLQLSTEVHNTGGNLVQFIQISRSIVVRPSGQPGPYPTGYLAVVEGFTTQTSKNGNELYRCRVGAECLFFCFGVGNSISSMEVKEVLADGSLADVPSENTGPALLDTSRDVYWKFQAEENSGDSDGISTFQCKATDGSQGGEATKLVDVEAQIQSSVDQTRSQVTVEVDPNDPTAKRLTFQCAIRGRPLPTVVFYGGSLSVFPIFADGPTSVTRTGPYEAIASLVVTMDTMDLNQSIERIRLGWDTSPSCVIYSDAPGTTTSHDFYPTEC